MSRAGRLTIALAGIAVAAASAAALATVSLAGASTHGTSAATTVGPGPVATTLARNGYTLQFALKPNKPTVAGTVSVRLAHNGKPVNHARVRITFTMAGMGGLTGLLPQTATGLYSHPGPILGMSGRWAIRLDVTPRDGARFSVGLVDRLGA